MKGMLNNNVPLAALELCNRVRDTVDAYEEDEWNEFEGLELFLNLFELIPDDIMLQLASHDLELYNANACVCGWAVREGIARLVGVEAEAVSLENTGRNVPRSLLEAALPLAMDYNGSVVVPAMPETNVLGLCVLLFGGTAEAWHRLFMGVVEEEAPVIERAMILRLNQIA